MKESPLILTRAARALRRKGPSGFLRLSLYNLQLLVTGGLARHSYVYDKSFDRQHGVDTAGVAEVDEIEAPAETMAQARRYEATPPECFRFLLRETRIADPGDYSFVDLGSGKGRVLILAALAGFKDVVGVELGRRLHRTAVGNLKKLAELGRPAGVRCINGDAARFRFPPRPTLCFLNNPFGAEVLGRVLDNIEASLAGDARDFVLIYYHPDHRAVLDGRVGWTEVASGCWRDKGHGYAIYRISAQACAEAC